MRNRLPVLTRTLALLAVLLASAGAARLRAQDLPDSLRHASRQELSRSLSLLESSAASPAYSSRTRRRAADQVAAVRSRLSAGDFRVGDQIRLRVVGATQLLDSVLTVADSVILHVPGIRDVRLYGILRSELTAHLVRELGQVVREVQVYAYPLIRVAVVGQVVTPGFRAVSEETLVDQLITLAGGPTTGAALGRIRLVRADTTILAGEQVSLAIASGRTLSDLELRDGDSFVVPAASAPWDRTAVLQTVTLFLGPILTLLAVR